MDSGKKKLAILIAGPTGVGKTRLSEMVAEALPVEIVSADSRQIYKYMNIGTAKPGKKMLEKIPHHFVDILEPDRHFSAGDFGELARQTVREIFDRQRVPLIVGGSGLYIKALLEGFFSGDVRDLKIREELTRRMEKEGPEKMHRWLAEVDPASAAKIHPNNSQRILRALEVFLSSGQRLSDLQKNKLPDPDFETLRFALNSPRHLLYQRINQRVLEMIGEGLVEEVRQLLNRGYSPQLNSLNTVGYKEILRHFNGEISLQEAIELIQRNTRRYAKRQLTWFRADQELQWIEIQGLADLENACRIVVEQYNQRLEQLD